MRNEPWVWPEVRDAGTSGAGAVPLRSAQLMGQQKKKKKKSCQLADSSPRSMAQPVMPAVGGKMYTDACSVFTAITGPLLSPC